MGFEMELHNPSRDDILRAFGIDPVLFREFEKAKGAVVAGPKLLLVDAVNDFLRQSAEAGNTNKTYPELLPQFVKHMEHKWRDDPKHTHTVDRITAADIRAFVFRPKLNGEARSENSQKRDRSILHAFFNWLVGEGVLRQNPVKKVKVKQRLGAPVALSEHEQQLLLDLSRRTRNGIKNHTIITLVLNTGLRAQEVCDLTWSSIDFENNWLYVKGKGGKDAAVPLLPTVVNCLKYYRRAVRQKLKAAPGYEDYVFINEQGTRAGCPMTVDGLEDMLGRLLRKMGKPKGCNFHVLRHSFAVNLLRRGVHLAVISHLLRHSNWETTRRYLRLGDKTIADEFAKYFPEGVLVPATLQDISVQELKREVYAAFGEGGGHG